MTRPNPYLWNGKWYFYDECEMENGPFDTEQIAAKALRDYCDWLDQGSAAKERDLSNDKTK